MAKYTNAKYPDKINDLVDNDGNVNIPGGASLPAIPLGYSFEELRSGNGLATRYLSDIVVALFADSNYIFLRIVTTDNVYLENALNLDVDNYSFIINNHGVYMAADGHMMYDGDLTGFYLDNYREITLPEPPEPDPELDFEHKMTLKIIEDPKGVLPDIFEVNIDNSSITLDDGDKIQLFRAPISRGYPDDRAVGEDPQIYIDLSNPGVICDFLREPEEGYNYELRPGEKSRIIEGQQMDLYRLNRPCLAETLGLSAYDIYFNEKENVTTFVWNGNVEAIT